MGIFRRQSDGYKPHFYFPKNACNDIFLWILIYQHILGIAFYFWLLEAHLKLPNKVVTLTPPFVFLPQPHSF